MSDDRLFGLDEVPEVPLFREPRRPRGAPIMDERLDHDYPPDWDRCSACDGYGSQGSCAPGESLLDLRRRCPCPRCLGMGSLKARVRLEAGHRCVRCGHPYMPKGDAAMLGVAPSGIGGEHMGGRWSACDERCTHGGPFRMLADGEWSDSGGPASRIMVGVDIVPCAEAVEAEWRILTVHHLDGDKANVRWWNLAALCQRCHLEIQGRVVMERVYPHEHSEWFKPFVAGYYAWVYLQEDLTRDEVAGRMDELLALERMA